MIKKPLHKEAAFKPHLSDNPPDLAPCSKNRLPGITGPVPSTTLDKEIFSSIVFYHNNAICQEKINLFSFPFSGLAIISYKLQSIPLHLKYP